MKKKATKSSKIRVRTLYIKMGEDKYIFIKGVLEKVMKELDVNEARALELILADFNAGYEQNS